MPLKENDVRFFRPLWIRLTVTAVLAAALAYELIWTHDQLWIGIWACGIAYCGYNFFWKWPKDLPPLEKPATASATLRTTTKSRSRPMLLVPAWIVSLTAGPAFQPVEVFIEPRAELFGQDRTGLAGRL